MHDDGSAWLEVQDNGPGIAQQDHERIFEWGRQVLQPPVGDDHSRGAKTGLGLGLALVRGIVRAHGGDVTVRSALGVGATFCVTLPARQTNERTAPP